MRKNIYSILAAALVIGLLLSAVGCGKKDSNKLVVGITDFEPMNYRDSSGKWIGFDTELAEMVGEKLGLEVVFQEIEWGSKYQELEARTIDCIWNGFTANASESDGTPRSDLVDFSYSYLLNQQCVVIKAAKAGEFKSIGDLAGKTIAAESGSAGEEVARDAAGDDGKIVGTAAQVNTFIEVKSGAVDCAVVDILLAQRSVGTGDYSDLSIAAINMDSEVYAVGFRKGDALRDQVNTVLSELSENGKLAELAAKYELSDSLLLDTSFGK